MSRLRMKGGQPIAPPASGRYVNILGSDASAGSGAAPWRYVPRDPAAGGAVPSYVLAAGEHAYLARGQRHRPASYASRGSSHLQLAASGTSGSQIVYEAYGAGANPKLSGDEAVTGWSAATSGDVGGNPSWASIQKADVSGLVDLSQAIFEGDDYLVPAQWPTPGDPYSFNRVTSGLSGYLTLSVAEWASKVTYGANDSGGAGYKTVTLVSDTGTGNFKDHYATAESAPVPGAARIVCFMTGARYTEFDITGYDVATGTVSFKIGNTSNLHVSGSSSGLMRYAMRYNPFDIRKVGQYGWGPDAAGVRKAYGMFRGSAERSVGRSIPYGVKLTRDYITLKNLDIERFGGSLGQAVMQTSVEGTRAGLTLENVTVRQCANQNSNWLLYFNAPGGSNGMTFTNLEVVDCPYSGAIALVNCANVVIDGFIQRVEGRTPLYFGGTANNNTVRNFIVSDWDSAHGNGVAIYEKARDITLENGYAMNRPRGLSVQTTLTVGEGDRNNTIRNFVSTTKKPLPGAFSESNYALQGGDGERGSLIEGCIFGISPTLLHPGAGAPASTGMVIRNCVISSLVCAELPGISFESCLIFKESGGGITGIEAKGGTVIGNVVFDVGGSWQGVITEAMQQALTRNPGGVGYTQRSLGPASLPWVIPAYGAAFALADCALTTTTIRAGRDAEDTFASVVATQPGSAISLPAGQGSNDLFGLWKGQVYALAPLTAGAYNLHVLQTNAHPNLTGPATRTTIIAVTVI